MLIAAIAVLVVIIWRRAPGLTTLAAALIGAIAIAFKDTLTNLIAGIMLLWSGSFRVGDIIRIDRENAKPTSEPYVVVKSISLLHVVLRARDGMQILIPNSHLASVAIDIHLLTPAGRQLARIADNAPDESAFKAQTTWFQHQFVGEELLVASLPSRDWTGPVDKLQWEQVTNTFDDHPSEKGSDAL